MTRERVEQAIELYAKAWKDAHPFPSAEDVQESERFLEALTTLSNALAESEKERERLLEALEPFADAIDNAGVMADRPDEYDIEGFLMLTVGDLRRARQALSPDSQEKRDG